MNDKGKRIRIANLRRRGSSGSAAVEFALIAPLFFLLLFASFETGMTYFADMTLANGVEEAARLIRTGQAQSANMTQTQFRQVLCDQIKTLMSCDPKKLYIDVRAFSSFGTASYPQALDQNQKLNPNLDAYQLGSSSATAGADDIVLVRAFYEWQLYTPLFSAYYANMANDTRLLSASVAFRNEPF